MWSVLYHPEAEPELDELPVQERVAVLHAAEKLAALGPDLRYPHQSEVRDGDGLRELRPRAGRSRWRAFYQQHGETHLIAATARQAEGAKRGLLPAVRAP